MKAIVKKCGQLQIPGKVILKTEAIRERIKCIWIKFLSN